MKTGPFDYIIKIECEFTGDELLLLFENARSHYDLKCRMAGNPAVNVGEWVGPGGEIWGLLNELALKDEMVGEETPEDMFRRVCRARPNDTVKRAFDSRTLGLFQKIIEMDSSPEASQLRLNLRDAVSAMKEEHFRLTR